MQQQHYASHWKRILLSRGWEWKIKAPERFFKRARSHKKYQSCTLTLLMGSERVKRKIMLLVRRCIKIGLLKSIAWSIQIGGAYMGAHSCALAKVIDPCQSIFYVSSSKKPASAAGSLFIRTQCINSQPSSRLHVVWNQGPFVVNVLLLAASMLICSNSVRCIITSPLARHPPHRHVTLFDLCWWWRSFWGCPHRCT
jgi:hypothetical protein